MRLLFSTNLTFEFTRHYCGTPMKTNVKTQGCVFSKQDHSDDCFHNFVSKVLGSKILIYLLKHFTSKGPGRARSLSAGRWLRVFLWSRIFYFWFVKYTKTASLTEKGQIFTWFISKCNFCCIWTVFSCQYSLFFMKQCFLNAQKLHCSLRKVVRFRRFVSKCNFHSIWTGFLAH